MPVDLYRDEKPSRQTVNVSFGSQAHQSGTPTNGSRTRTRQKHGSSGLTPPGTRCAFISAGCKNCYAREMVRRLESVGTNHTGLTRKMDKRLVWNGKVIEDRESLEIPYRWKNPRKVFVNSMSNCALRLPIRAGL